MGHSGCGGVKAALDREAARETEGQFITKWMSMLEPARLSVLAGHQGSSRKDMASALEREGVKLSLQNLRSFPFVVRDLEAKGRLNLHGAYFDIATGQLSALNERTGEYYSL